VQTEGLGLKFLAGIPYDGKVESAIGNTKKLFDTVFARKVNEIAQKV